MPPVIFLMGPTASGKTGVALELARHLPCDIVSVDSTQIYRGMDIGTAKPSPAVLAETPHRLIDIRDPAESYSAEEFRHDALEAMARITARGRIPLLVGGTMFYFRALEQGLSCLPSGDPEVRQRIAALAEDSGWEALHQRLKEIDPEAAGRIHPNDRQRIQRALEVFEIEGKTLTALYTGGRQQELPYRVIKLALAPPREVLHERVAQRFHDMLAQGFIDEVTGLYRRGDLSLHKPAMRAVGYRQAWNYLAGKSSYLHMRERAIVATRQFAKRQLTWLRAEPDVTWFDSSEVACAARIGDYLRTKIY